ncbi:hypothetical protein BWQ96_02372 [Gracilariopsis chorda]|uniref:Uncharacterized protein n=1 Tax=Gracilariopsis chorda TaxID=448386 RepID=A0A2V3J098_9FLOR|nr:hypothetical protein BWQ96_02372 [Gracilariopsis chorda]|eukprot:PXF47836.1 hypothetical protein BWQ96_02372 [Gracilariopsis chorda]
MTASVCLPTTAASVNPPSKLHQTPPSTTASRTLQPPFCTSIHPSLITQSKTAHRTTLVIPFGSRYREISTSPKTRQQFLFDLSASTANSIHDLPKDESCEGEDARTYVTDLLVCSDAQSARKAIFNDVVSTFRRMHKSDVQQSYRYPVVILATEKAAFFEPYQVRGDHEQTNAQNVYGAQAQFLALWRGAVAHDANVLALAGENSDRVKASLEAVLEADGLQWISTPVSLVLYVSFDSVITANLSSIRRICESQNIKFCV